MTEFQPSHASLEEIARSNRYLYQFKTLVLNADFTPMSYLPLSVENWTQIMWWLGKGWSREVEGLRPIITVLEEYEGVFVHSHRRDVPLPAVVAHVRYQRVPERLPFTRDLVLLRDNYTCQYTGKVLPKSQLTFDHVIPLSRGGPTTWTNIVAAEQRINEFKGNRTPEEAGLHLIRQPYKPTIAEMMEKSRRHGINSNIPDCWRPYLETHSRKETA